PRRGRQAASGAEVSAEEGATPRARPLHGRGGHGHRRRAATGAETTLERSAATDALHPFAHERPALFNAAVHHRADAIGASRLPEKIYIESVGCAALRPARRGLPTDLEERRHGIRGERPQERRRVVRDDSSG